MNARGVAEFTLRLLLAVAATFAPSAGADDAKVVLDVAQFVRTPSGGPPPDVQGEAVTLPDTGRDRPTGESGIAWYRLKWTIDRVHDHPYAIYLTGTTMPVRVFLNGNLLGSTGPFFGPPPRSYLQSQSFDVPPSMLEAGENRVDLAVLAQGSARKLDVVWAGPESIVRPRVMRDMLVHTVAPAFVSVTTLVVGVFILALWVRRREKAYGMFGVASVLWGVHTAASLLPTPPLPAPHYAIWWHAVYMAFVVMLSLFCANFSGVASRLFDRAGAAFVLLVAPVLYVASALGALAATTAVVRAVGIMFVLVALAAVVRYAWRARNLESVLFLVTGAVSATFGVHDWLAAQDPLAVRPVWLVPYAALFFLTLVGWILVDRFVLARNESERLNDELERRVQEKGAALSTQLASTEEARRVALAAQQRAEAADRAKSRFLAAASHDLRQPLHALGLFAEALSERARDPEDATLVRRITMSVESLEALFSALLDVSRLDAGVVTATPRDMLLEPLFERLANDFSPEAVEKCLRLAVVPTRYAVRSDPVLLERILRNLLANALKYTERGGVVLGARRRGDEVSIEVWDSGQGIAPVDQPRVFEEFYQVGNPERDRARGLGLGLAIVRRLADLLGHALVLESRPGRGSVFRIRLPRVDASPLAEMPGRSGIAEASLAGQRVLVVDDDPSVRESVCRALDSWHCISESLAVPEAVAPGAPIPDVMLVDYRLRNGVDGVTAIAELRQRFGSAVPAIIVSGESLPEELARIDATGILLLHKPVPPAKLRAALMYVLKQREETIA